GPDLIALRRQRVERGRYLGREGHAVEGGGQLGALLRGVGHRDLVGRAREDVEVRLGERNEDVVGVVGELGGQRRAAGDGGEHTAHAAARGDDDEVLIDGLIAVEQIDLQGAVQHGGAGDEQLVEGRGGGEFHDEGASGGLRVISRDDDHARRETGADGAGVGQVAIDGAAAEQERSGGQRGRADAVAREHKGAGEQVERRVSVVGEHERADALLFDGAGAADNSAEGCGGGFVQHERGVGGDVDVLIGRQGGGAGDEATLVDNGAAGVGVLAGERELADIVFNNLAVAGNHAAEDAVGGLFENQLADDAGGVAVDERDITVGRQIGAGGGELAGIDDGAAGVGVFTGERRDGLEDGERRADRRIGVRAVAVDDDVRGVVDDTRAENDIGDTGRVGTGR